MRLTYDAEADAAYVHVKDAIAAGRFTRTEASMLDLERASVSFNFNAEGKVIGIEILGASRVLPSETLSPARISGDACD